MIGGLPEMNDQGNLALSGRHGIPVISVDYRLAPEHPYPAGPDDGIAVARWLLEHAGKPAADGGFGTDRLIVGGESAGGYLAAAVLLRIRDELQAIEHVLGANLVFGVHDWRRSPSQRGLRPHRGPDMLDPEGICFSAGGEVDVFVGPDLPHGFMAFPCALVERWAQQTDDWFRRLLTD